AATAVHSGRNRPLAVVSRVSAHCVMIGRLLADRGRDRRLVGPAGCCLPGDVLRGSSCASWGTAYLAQEDREKTRRSSDLPAPRGAGPTPHRKIAKQRGGQAIFLRLEGQGPPRAGTSRKNAAKSERPAGGGPFTLAAYLTVTLAPAPSRAALA